MGLWRSSAAYKHESEWDAAIADFTEAIRLDPKLVWAYQGRGDAYRKKAEWNKAIADYTEVLRLDPKNAGAYFGRGCYTPKGSLIKRIGTSPRLNRLGTSRKTIRKRYSIRVWLGAHLSAWCSYSQHASAVWKTNHGCCTW